MDAAKQRKNEAQFKNWMETPSGGRIYRLEILGKWGWKAHYVKEVDTEENTVAFRQEIYDQQGILRELHEKYPVDKGHIKLS
ncbi:MAG: hypothetical protein JNK89_09785 [Saprospiraceae bacterium]|nr:hypothetical protein [Saprospiraceae bacterium]